VEQAEPVPKRAVSGLAQLLLVAHRLDALLVFVAPNLRQLALSTTRHLLASLHETCFQKPRGFEYGHAPRRDVHRFLGLRVAGDLGFAELGGQHAEASDFDAVTLQEHLAHLVDKHLDEFADVTFCDVGMYLASDCFYQVGFRYRHGCPPLATSAATVRTAVATRLRRRGHFLLGPGDRERREAAGELRRTALRAGKLVFVTLAQNEFLEFVVADIATEFTNWHKRL
jgi:hypothetical protein